MSKSQFTYRKNVPIWDYMYLRIAAIFDRVSTRTNRDCVSIRKRSCAQPQMIPIPIYNAHRHERRGVAMMLVLATIAVVTVSTVAYLSTQNSQPTIGQNVTSGAQARSAAETGVDLTVAIMQADNINWRTAHTNGVLVDSYNFGGGTVTVTVADLNGNPPDATTEYVVVDAVGECDGHSQIAQAEVYAPLETRDVDIDLSEFAAFGVQQIELSGGVLQRWTQSPRAPLKEALRLGTNNLRSGAVSLSADSSMSSGKFYVSEGASATVLDDKRGNDYTIDRVDATVNEAIPIPAPPTPDTSGCSMASPYRKAFNKGDWGLENSMEYGRLYMWDGATLTTQEDNQVLHVTGNVELSEYARIIVRHSLDLVVDGDLSVSSAAIEIRDEGVLRLFVRGNIIFDDCVVGLPIDGLVNPDSRIAEEGIGYYRNPERCQIYQIVDPELGSQEFDIRNRSFVCGRLYAPGSVIEIKQDSAVFGNLIGDTIITLSGSYLHYDHTLDKRRGYTSTSCGMYDNVKDLDDLAIAKISTLDKSSVDEVNDYMTVKYGEPIEEKKVQPINPVVSPRNRRAYSKLKRLGMTTNQ